VPLSYKSNVIQANWLDILLFHHTVSSMPLSFTKLNQDYVILYVREKSCWTQKGYFQRIHILEGFYGSSSALFPSIRNPNFTNLCLHSNLLIYWVLLEWVMMRSWFQLAPSSRMWRRFQNYGNLHPPIPLSQVTFKKMDKE